MRRYQQLATIAFAALGVLLVWQGVALRLQGEFGPGPGFMAFLVGSLLSATSVAYGVGVTLAGPHPFPPDALPDGAGVLRVAAVIAALLALAGLFTVVGFKIAVLCFLLGTLFVFGSDHRIPKLVVAVVFSFGLAALLERVLRVALPGSSIEFLANLGL